MKVSRGDVVWVSPDPAIGHEQAGHRPYLVLSDERLHNSRFIVIAVPMTSKPHPIPTHHQLAPGSWALCEQPKSFSTRRITKVEATGHDVAPVRAIINRLIGG
jgi:mRNA interferase MazF